MQEFTSRMPFIVFFLVGTLLINMTFGEKVTNRFLVLVLCSMVVVNANKINGLLGKVKF